MQSHVQLFPKNLQISTFLIANSHNRIKIAYYTYYIMWHANTFHSEAYNVGNDNNLQLAPYMRYMYQVMK